MQLAQAFREALSTTAVDTLVANQITADANGWTVAGVPMPDGPGSLVRVLGLGKAALGMAAGFDRVASARAVAVEGLVITTADALAEYTDTPCPYPAICGSHPIPDAASMRAARAAQDFLAAAPPADAVCVLLSGGGSALAETPIDGWSMADVTKLHRAGQLSGLDIVTLNAIRGLVSSFKGGRLLAATNRTSVAPAVTLVLADVPEGHEATVASAPTMTLGSLTPERLDTALAKLHGNQAPRLRAELAGSKIPQLLRNTDSRVARHTMAIAGDNETVRRATITKLEGLGFTAVDCGADHGSDTRDPNLSTAVEQLREAWIDASRRLGPDTPVALVSGGELSVPLPENARDVGCGGRNHAFVLEFLLAEAGEARISPHAEWAVLSAGTDGRDGAAPSAGAVADAESLRRAGAKSLDARAFAAGFDSWTFFNALEDTVQSPTLQHNVRDVRILATRPDSN